MTILCSTTKVSDASYSGLQLRNTLGFFFAAAYVLCSTQCLSEEREPTAGATTMSDKSPITQFVVPNGESTAAMFRERQRAARELIEVLVTDRRDLAEMFVSGAANPDTIQGNIQKASAVEVFYNYHEVDRDMFPTPRDMQAFLQLNIEEIRSQLNG